MATSYSVFIKMHTQGASQTSNDIKKIETSSKSASLAADGLSKTLGILAGALAVGKVVAANDAWITYTNTLKATGLAGDQLLKTQQDLFDIAQQTRVGISETADIYRALKTTIGEAGASEEDLLKVTRALNEGIIQSGASAQQAQGGIIQLSQVFEKGKLQAQEYNSIVSDFPAIGNKLREVFLQASDGTKTFRQQMEEGSISATAFFDALKLVAPELDKTQSSMQETASQGITKLENSFEKLVGTSSEVLHTNSLLQKAFDFLSERIDGVSNAAQSLNKTMNSSNSGFVDYLKSISKLILETSPLGAMFSGTIKDIEGYIDSIQTASEKTEEMSATLAKLNNISPISKQFSDLGNLMGVNTISANEFNKALANIGTDYSGAGLDKLKADLASGNQAANDFKQQAADFGRVMSSINFSSVPSLGENIFGESQAQSIARYKDLVKEAQQEIIKTGQVAPATMQAITVGGDQIMSWNNLKSIVDTVGNDISSSFGSAVANIVTGSQSASEAFKQMANSIISDLIRIGIEKAIIGTISGISSGFSTGGLATKNPQKFATGGAVSGAGTSTSDSIPAMLSDGEFVMRASAVRSIGAGNLAKLNSGGIKSLAQSNLNSFSSQQNNITINTTVNNTNQGSSANPNDQQRQSSEQAKLIANLVSTQVKQELVKQTRVGGMLHSGSK